MQKKVEYSNNEKSVYNLAEPLSVVNLCIDETNGCYDNKRFLPSLIMARVTLESAIEWADLVLGVDTARSLADMITQAQKNGLLSAKVTADMVRSFGNTAVHEARAFLGTPQQVLRESAELALIACNLALTEMKANLDKCITPAVKAFLVFNDKTVAIEHLPFKIGRASVNDLVLADATVSAKHAVIYFRSGLYFIHNMSSTNGTSVFGEAVDKRRLNSGDSIQLGRGDKDGPVMTFYIEDAVDVTERE
jgi:hypothetical protein